MEKEISVAWMYPDILNLHGDRGNIMAFERIGEELGIKVNVHRINNYEEEIDIENMDIMFLSPCELKAVPKVVEALSKYKNKLEDKTVIAIGTSGAILANKTLRRDETIVEGLGLLDMDCKEKEWVFGDDIYFEIGNKEIIGCQIQMIDIELGDVEPLGKTKYGRGNNGTGFEGARHNNIIFTNAIGPVFVKNPWWTEEIIRDIIGEIDVEPEYKLERASFETTKKFIRGKV